MHFKDGLIHNDAGPAVIHQNGDAYFYQNGLLHRENKPCTVLTNGEREWRVYGKLYRAGGGAVMITADKTKFWFDDDGQKLVLYMPVKEQKRPEPAAPFFPAESEQVPKAKNDVDEVYEKTAMVMDMLERAKNIGMLIKVVKRRETGLLYYFQDPDNDSVSSGSEFPVDIRTLCGAQNAELFSTSMQNIDVAIASRTSRVMRSIKSKLTVLEQSVLGI